MESIPVEAFLDAYPDPIRSHAMELRALVQRAVPEAIEGVRLGWRLIGYDIPLRPRRAYFAYIAPEPEHIHLGFEYGAWMSDPDGLLEGAHIGLRQVRFVTFRPGDIIRAAPLEGLVREAARLAAMSREQRLALALDP